MVQPPTPVDAAPAQLLSTVSSLAMVAGAARGAAGLDAVLLVRVRVRVT